MQLIEFTDKGLYCRPGDFYIDPWKPVDKAVITHAHSDHARAGSKAYLSHPDSIPLLRYRLGEHEFQGLPWNQPLKINDVTVTLFPAGHVIGSSQVRIEYKGETWVFSGDYKTEDDGISGVFEPVKCNSFITESTFGLPLYKWQNKNELDAQLCSWVEETHQQKRVPVLIAYSLGKAQRVINAVSSLGKPIYGHGAIWNTQQVLLEAGWDLPKIERVTNEVPRENYRNAIIIAPPSADGTPWMKKFSPSSVGICSGWMQVRGNARRRNADAGFVISDHADWPGLLDAVKATGAEQVYVTHGFQSAFSRYLNEQGILSKEVKTEYGDEEDTTKTEDDA